MPGTSVKRPGNPQLYRRGQQKLPENRDMSIMMIEPHPGHHHQEWQRTEQCHHKATLSHPVGCRLGGLQDIKHFSGAITGSLDSPNDGIGGKRTRRSDNGLFRGEIHLCLYIRYLFYGFLGRPCTVGAAQTSQFKDVFNAVAHDGFIRPRSCIRP